uniref:Putative secreted protein n=1 Tax=Ixodes ricinus TaxID=34613 RepID=V5H5Y5_IXORI
MTATLNPAWRLILRLLLVVVCVEICSCQKVSSTSNLEGNHPCPPLCPRPSDSVPKGTEQEKGNNPDNVVDVIEVTEPPATTSTRRGGSDVLSVGSIVVPVVVGGNGNEKTNIKNIDTASQGSQKPNQTPEGPKPGLTTVHEDEGQFKKIESGKPGSGTHDPLANVNVTEFIERNCGKAHSLV